LARLALADISVSFPSWLGGVCGRHYHPPKIMSSKISFTTAQIRGKTSHLSLGCQPFIVCFYSCFLRFCHRIHDLAFPRPGNAAGAAQLNISLRITVVHENNCHARVAPRAEAWMDLCPSCFPVKPVAPPVLGIGIFQSQGFSVELFTRCDRLHAHIQPDSARRSPGMTDSQTKTPPASGSLLERIQERYGSLRKSERVVADYLRDNARPGLTPPSPTSGAGWA
jgi:hypothetical protein